MARNGGPDRQEHGASRLAVMHSATIVLVRARASRQGTVHTRQGKNRTSGRVTAPLPATPLAPPFRRTHMMMRATITLLVLALAAQRLSAQPTATPCPCTTPGYCQGLGAGPLQNPPRECLPALTGAHIAPPPAPLERRHSTCAAAVVCTPSHRGMAHQPTPHDCPPPVCLPPALPPPCRLRPQQHQPQRLPQRARLGLHGLPAVLSSSALHHPAGLLQGPAQAQLRVSGGGAVVGGGARRPWGRVGPRGRRGRGQGG